VRERVRAFAWLLTYLRRVLRTIITRISLRNSLAIESAGNIIRSPDLARVDARKRRTAHGKRQSSIRLSYPLVPVRVHSVGRISLRNSARDLSPSLSQERSII